MLNAKFDFDAALARATELLADLGLGGNERLRKSLMRREAAVVRFANSPFMSEVWHEAAKAIVAEDEILAKWGVGVSGPPDRRGQVWRIASSGTHVLIVGPPQQLAADPDPWRHPTVTLDEGDGQQARDARLLFELQGDFVHEGALGRIFERVL